MGRWTSDGVASRMSSIDPHSPNRATIRYQPEDVEESLLEGDIHAARPGPCAELVENDAIGRRFFVSRIVGGQAEWAG